MNNYRDDFPILNQTVNDKPLCYVDNASTTQKPQAVLDAIIHFYTTNNANIYRGIHAFGEKATTLYENTRSLVAQFIGAHHADEIIFTRNTTESINFVAETWAMQHITKNDEIVLTELEHHANLLPWQRVAQKTGAQLKFIPVLPDGSLDYATIQNIITPRTKLVAFSPISNALGTHVDTQLLIKHAREIGAKILIDAAQLVPHQKINVSQLDCDFLAFSGHKMLGPTGVGVLYIKKELHEIIPPYNVGGGIVFEANWHNATWLKSPHKYEAGTPPIAQVIGLGAAIEYLKKIDFEHLAKYEAALCAQLIDGLSQMPKITILGPIEQLRQKGHLVSFLVKNVHAHDVAAYLDQNGIFVRAGHHCAQPLAKKLGFDACTRISFYLYNTPQEVDRIIKTLDILIKSI